MIRFLRGLGAWLLCFPCVCAATDFLDNIADVPLTPVESATLSDRSGKLTQLPQKYTPFNSQRAQIPFHRAILADRSTYMADDPVGQVLVYVLTPSKENPLPSRVQLELKRDDNVIASQTITNKVKFSALLPLDSLQPGSYEITGQVDSGGKLWTITPARFAISPERRNAEEIPQSGIPMVLQHAPLLGSQASPIITGIPISRHQAMRASEFSLLENGIPVPAQFTERATWYPGREIKWLGLSFLAKYSDGRPAEYRVVRQNPPKFPTPLTVQESPEAFEITTGAITFTIGRKPFTGIRSVKIAGTAQPIVNGNGGAFLVDERDVFYSSKQDETAEVTLEENGPVRVTVLAKGWLTNARNEKLCRYEIRMTAWSGQPWIDVQQRTILTYNTDEKRLRQLGFSLSAAEPNRWTAGLDGSSVSGEIGALTQPEKSSKPSPVPSPTATGWLIQSRDDEVAIENDRGALARGRKSDGWLRLDAPDAGSLLVSVRHLWQLFPKEIAWGPNAMIIYQWPAHGRDAFSDDEELHPDHIHKIRYAHEGQYLDLKFPQKYFDTLRKVFPPIIENQDINALSGNGMGLAITTNFRLQFAREISEKDSVGANQMFAADLHGISDPVWNGLTEVEGRFAGSQPGVTEDWDAFYRRAFHGYTASVDILGDYGMWIWPDVHNNWSTTLKRPQPHRWWLNSHYQNVWDYNFMYFLSGNARNKDWANAASQHFMDVGTVNYADPDRPLLGKLPGANYHVKGFTPWGSARAGEVVGDDYVEVAAHFINPDASLFRYLLFGEHVGLQIANQWFDSLGKVSLPPERSREACTTLGELISFYENTWNPQAISYIHELAEAMLSRPFQEIPSFPAHPFFHDRWVMRYWNFSGDTRIKDPVIAALKLPRNFPHWELNALAWRWTGDKKFLQATPGADVPPNRIIYQNAEDPLDGFGGRVFKPTHSLTQTMPYYLQALLDSGLGLSRTPVLPPSIAKPATIPKHDKTPIFLSGPVSARMNLPGEARIKLRVQAVTNARTWENRGGPGSVEIFDANGKPIAETSVLSGSLRPAALLELDSATAPLPWTITIHGDVLLGWSGAATELALSPLEQSQQSGGMMKNHPTINPD